MLRSRRDNKLRRMSCWPVGLAVLVVVSGCAKEPAVPERVMTSIVHKYPAGEEFSGFLSDYSKLEPAPLFDGEALTYVNETERERLRDYVAIIVDPVQLYVETDLDMSLVPEGGPEAAATYFRFALIEAVSDAFPLMSEAGPLTLRLRAALVGIDVGGEVTLEEDSGLEPLERSIYIGEVGVEMELVDSMTGEQIAAMVDKAPLGEGAEIGAVHFSRSERFDAAQEAFDEWALRLRLFLDEEHELQGDAAERADREYRPY